MLLDHLTRGRVIGGFGPGSLPTDSAMIGLNPTDTREFLETNLDIVVQLLAGETVTAKTPTHELVDARLQLAPYADGGIPLAVASVASPTGARLAGKHGIGLLSIGATLTVEGFNALSYHWDIVEERAATFGTQVNRKDWSLVGLFHLGMLQMAHEWANPRRHQAVCGTVCRRGGAALPGPGAADAGCRRACRADA